MMEGDEILMQLTESERDGSLQIFRRLITRRVIVTRMAEERVMWKPVLIKLLKLLSENQDCGKEQILLIPHAFLVLLHTQYEIDEFRSILKSYLQLNTNLLRSFDIDYNIQDLDLFKLLICHGYSQINRKEIYSGEICELLLEVLYQNCIRYTKYTHLAYKILHTWLQRTSETDFWSKCDQSLERKLEIIISSNWDNSIKEVAKQNSTSIFNKYLKIMNRKYEGFLAFVFQDCLDNISWLNETKYIILSEICDVWDDTKAITEKEFILCIFTSLTKNYLRTSGTKLYNSISNKLGEAQWKNAFGYPISFVISQWGYGAHQNHQALQLLCTQWLEPTIRKYRSILQFLWELSSDVANSLFHSHLERIASETGVFLEGGRVHTFIDHSNEYLRINSFATHCQKQTCLKDNDLENHFSLIKHFLFYNVNNCSTFLRRGIIKYFKIYFLSLLKYCNAQECYDEQVLCIFKWLHEFLLDCFELGSCYQRKILGIKLYEIILFFTNKREMNSELRNDPRYREDLNNGFKMREKFKEFGEWTWTNRTSLIWLFKLILDPATDIREASARIIMKHFRESGLNYSEKNALVHTAMAKCNSSKFYETESGATLVKILSKWLSFEEINAMKEAEFLSKETRRLYKSLTIHTNYIEYLLQDAHNQLGHIKYDILRAAMQNSPFHGTLTAILNLGFRNELNTQPITLAFTEKLLALLEKAVDFLLSLLSSKSNNCEFSSSFAEMGLAIDQTVKESEICDEYDDVVLSPAHQVVITCIWISLKVSCDLASEIGMLTYSYEIVKRSANLITSVLMKCRHKGAIEAAGVAIGHLTRKIVNVEDYKNLPEQWLNNLTSGDETTPNLTRRSAGLSIMFHRIVANDNRRGKPLVHIAIWNLLNLLEDASDTGKHEKVSMADINESYQDLPLVKYLHFLQRLVADSDLHVQVVPYLERITMKCFSNLQSQNWTVRNASLQLFGAIVPRIAGQHNGGQILDFGNGYSVDHFITHYSELANHIFLELKNAASGKKGLDATVKSHSAIVPSILLLSRMSTGGSDFIDYSSKIYICKVKQVLKLLFGSPIANVRILAAKAYAALVPFPEMNFEHQYLNQGVRDIKNSNFAHGYLCAIEFVGEKCRTDSEIPFYNERHVNVNQKPKFKRSKELSKRSLFDKFITENVTESTSIIPRMKEYLNNQYSRKFELNLCYFVEAMFLKVFQDLDSPEIFLFKQITEETDIVLSTERSKPGFSEFINTATRLYVHYINHSDNNIDTEIIRRILNSQCTDQSVTLLNNLESGTTVQVVILNHILKTFPHCEAALLDALIRYLNKSVNSYFSQSFVNVDEIRNKVCQLAEIIGEDKKYEKLKLYCCILINTLKFDGKLINTIVDYSCAKIYDDDEVVRKSTAECLPCLLMHFRKIENNNKFKIFRLCLALLKDEVSEIRELTRINIVYFIENYYSKNTISPSGEILYYKIFDIISKKNNILSDFSTIELVQFFSDYIASMSCTKDSKSSVESPFDHEDDATSAEETKLLNIIYCSISRREETEVLEDDTKLGDNILIDCGNIIEARNMIQAESNIVFSDFRTILDLSYTDYMLDKRNIVLKLCHMKLESVQK